MVKNVNAYVAGKSSPYPEPSISISVLGVLKSTVESVGDHNPVWNPLNKVKELKMAKFRTRKGLTEAAQNILAHYTLNPHLLDPIARNAISLAEAYLRPDHESQVRQIVPGSLLHSLEKENIIAAGLSEFHTLVTLPRAAELAFSKQKRPTRSHLYRWLENGRYGRRLAHLKIKNVIWTTVEEMKDFYWQSNRSRHTYLVEIGKIARNKRYYARLNASTPLQGNDPKPGLEITKESR